MRVGSGVGLLLVTLLAVGCASTDDGLPQGDGAGSAETSGAADPTGATGESGDTTEVQESTRAEESTRAGGAAAVSATVSVDSSIPDNEVDFGRVDSGAESVASVEVRNDLDAPMTIADTAVDDPSFELTDDGCTGVEVQPGDTCSVTVRFRPTNTQSYRGSLDIDVSYELTLFVTLKGIGQ